MTNGGRNLVILGIGSILITGITTGVSLAIYRTSGDIYLDRSRPGYLPDKEEIEDEPPATAPDFTFSDSGTLVKSDLDEYLKELEIIDKRLNELADPYSPTPLSDESLGIPSEFTGGISLRI